MCRAIPFWLVEFLLKNQLIACWEFPCVLFVIFPLLPLIFYLCLSFWSVWLLWFVLETNRDHSVIFEIASKYCISDSFVDHDSYSISSKGFLPTVVDIMVIWVKFTIPVYFSSLIPRMSTFTLAISCLTISNLPWFMDLTFQVPMQYSSFQQWTLLVSPVTSTPGYYFCFGSIPSFFL